MLRRNVVANAIGQAWSAILALASVPLYIYFLGVEAYGLVAFFTSLQALLAVLDLGLGTTANREVARRLAQPKNAGELRDLVRTLELAYVTVGILIAVGIVGAAGWLVRTWITTALPTETVRFAVVVVGVTLGLRWPVSLYLGVLLGTERQVLLNKVTMATATVRTVGAVGVLAFVEASLVAFLVWYLVAAAVELMTMATLAWRSLPLAGRRPAVAPTLLRDLWRFSLSLGGNSLLAALLKQSDRLILTKLLPVRYVGYYSAAHIAAGGLTQLVRPVMTAALPRFTALLATGDSSRLASAYHRLSQLVAATVAPVGAILIFFAEDILRIWTRSTELAANAATTLSVLALANVFNAMMQLPFALQLAAGITWIALLNNAISLLVLLPLMYVLIERFGVAGAGISWAVFNAAYFLIIPHVMHRHVLNSHAARWYWRDTVPFIAAALSIGAGVWAVRESGAGGVVMALTAITGALVYGSVAILLSETIRTSLRLLFDRGRSVASGDGAREAVTLSRK